MERIDLDALKRLESPKKVNPLQAHREEEPIKPPERYVEMDSTCFARLLAISVWIIIIRVDISLLFYCSEVWRTGSAAALELRTRNSSNQLYKMMYQ